MAARPPGPGGYPGAPGAPGAPGGYPPQGGQSYGGYPPQGGAPGQPGGYPPQGGAPGQPGAPGGYPPQGGAPGQPGAPGGYPPQQGYGQQSFHGQPGAPGAPGGYPPQQGYGQQSYGGYPQQGGYPPPGGAPAPGGYPAQRPPSAAAQQYYAQIPPNEIAELQKYFQAVDTDRSGSISAEELQKLRVGNLQGFNLDTAKKLVKVFDTDGTGNIGFYEYASLHRFVTSLQQAFAAFDRDKSGTLEFHEAQQALAQGGFYVSPNTTQKVFRRFASTPQGIKFEDFVQMCAFLGQVRSLFQSADYQRAGYITLTLDTFMDLCSNF